MLLSGINNKFTRKQENSSTKVIQNKIYIGKILGLMQKS